MRHLEANKVKDGWVVTITRTELAYAVSNVLDIVDYEGLKIRTRKKDDKGETIVIFAD